MELDRNVGTPFVHMSLDFRAPVTRDLSVTATLLVDGEPQPQSAIPKTQQQKGLAGESRGAAMSTLWSV